MKKVQPIPIWWDSLRVNFNREHRKQFGNKSSVDNKFLIDFNAASNTNVIFSKIQIRILVENEFKYWIIVCSREVSFRDFVVQRFADIIPIMIHLKLEDLNKLKLFD